MPGRDRERVRAPGCGTSALGKQLPDPCLPSGPAQLRSQPTPPGLPGGTFLEPGSLWGRVPPKNSHIPIPASSLRGHWDRGPFAPALGAALQLALEFGTTKSQILLQEPRDPHSHSGINPEPTLSKIPFSSLNLSAAFAGICGDPSPSPQRSWGQSGLVPGQEGPTELSLSEPFPSPPPDFLFFHEFIPPPPPAASAAANPDTSVHIWAGVGSRAASGESSWKIFTSCTGGISPPIPGLGPSKPDTEPGKLRVRL